MKSNGINEERVDVIQLKASISKITRKEKKKKIKRQRTHAMRPPNNRKR